MWVWHLWIIPKTHNGWCSEVFQTCSRNFILRLSFSSCENIAGFPLAAEFMAWSAISPRDWPCQLENGASQFTAFLFTRIEVIYVKCSEENEPQKLFCANLKLQGIEELSSWRGLRRQFEATRVFGRRKRFGRFWRNKAWRSRGVVATSKSKHIFFKNTVTMTLLEIRTTVGGLKLPTLA